MAFFMGFLTGPRKTACPKGARGWRHFGYGVSACIDHELAILGTAVAVLWASWGAPNQVGMWSFMALWGMRQSSKINVFLGVLNLGEAFLPPHLAYLTSFMKRRRMNWLMPFSILGGLFLVAILVRAAGQPGTTPFQAAGLACLITMLALAVLEHALLVLPLPFTALWSFFLRWSGRGAAPVAESQAQLPDEEADRRRPAAWPHDPNFNLSPASTAI
jgi:putative photosynthetic complex assembly protein 2